MQLNFFAGTAAELIKLYPVIRLARERGYKVRTIASGQSRENFLMQYRDLRLPQDELHTLLDDGADLAHVGSALRWFLRAVSAPQRLREKLTGGDRSFIVVHGDTLSTLAGAWLGRRLKQTVVHVEAGLRSGNLFQPFPEEIIRRLVSRLAHIHLAPDQTAAENLRIAHVRGTVVNTQGNTLIDAILQSESPERESVIGSPFALINIHRFENLNSRARWQEILRTVVKTAQKMKTIFIAHPQMRLKLERDPAAMAVLTQANVEVRERIPFTEYVGLLRRSQFMISDGGGNQEECFYLGKPCLLMREFTERIEGLGATCVLSRFERTVIDRFLDHPPAIAFAPRPTPHTPSPSQNVLTALEKQ